MLSSSSWLWQVDLIGPYQPALMLMSRFNGVFPCGLLCSIQEGHEYIVQQGKRKHVRLGSVVGQARIMQKAVALNDKKRVTV